MTIKQIFIYACLALGAFIWIITLNAQNSSVYDFRRSNSSSSGCSIATVNGSSHIGRKLITALTDDSPVALRNPFDTCILPQFDPWDANIVPYVDPDYNPLQKCNRSYRPMTTLKNGIVTVNEKNVSCMGRTER
ncbi:unnamed protein product [Cylicocyclus nassatus]|uniref:Uncharacterized protein n=1 Tax=Cylicocyclus nassatus TaxID=53992 RepID=A0AA36GZ78_CYLNA|nr:unnamed protein product [Cylicocyclus nassatus]